MAESFEQNNNQPKRVKELLEVFEQQEQPPRGELIKFAGFENKDIYNPTAPITIDDKEYIVARVEPREAELDSQVCFFEEKNGVWLPAPNTPIFDLQDPFIKKIGPEFVLGGVKVLKPEKSEENPDYYTEFFHLNPDYHTEFFRGEHLNALTKFARGQSHMKDIRMLSLPSGEVVVFTRPQGIIGGKGKIGFTIIPNLDALAKTDFLQAKLIEGQFHIEEWGGANELHLLEDGRIGVLGHIACLDEEGGKHYYATSFIFDPKTGSVSPLKIIATRKNFPITEAKNSKLEDIVFPGGLVRNKDGTATLYVGLSDTSAGSITIPDPFLEF
jgi:hypothetical protein